MKTTLFTALILLEAIGLYGQSFEFNPSTQKLNFRGTTGDAAIDFSIKEDQNNYQFAEMTIRDAEGHAFVELTYDDGGRMVLSKFDEDFKTEISQEAINLMNKNGLIYQVDVNDGFRVFNNDLPVYRLSQEDGFQTFDTRGQALAYVKEAEMGILRNGTDPKVRISESSGLEVFNNNNGNLMYRMNGQILSGYKNDGTETIRINTNQGGDGRISTDELEIMGGSDLSENFDIVDEESLIEPGMIVSIKGKEGKLTISKIRRDRKVVGVVSGANGIETGLLMGQKGSIADGDYPIALTGRTFVFVTSENGPIEPGDFITTSSKPGYGMKVKNYRKSQGAIIGKAMTSLNEETGIVLVLVNLQ